nr:hypothetical protein RKHAN_02514 [Rhizobium sp. Khangiran2]
MRWILPRRVDPRWAKAKEALVVLAMVAAEDSDYATRANGVGFNRADSTKGHAFAQLSVQSVLQDEATYANVLGMAARYRRQASKIG